MEQLNMNHILDRKTEEKEFIESLAFFELNKKNILTKRGIYIYGSPGSGKTYFVREVLKKLDYDIIHFDAGDVRNKSAIETITKHNISDNNIISLFYKKKKKIAIIMDEIDGMNSGDKGGINSLIKLIRPKKTKKQKKENITMIPIVCVGNYHIDKKIKELMKVCHTIELKIPSDKQIEYIVKLLMPNFDSSLLETTVKYIQGDLRKLCATYEIYKNQAAIFKNQIIQKFFQPKAFNEDTKEITKKLLNHKFEIKDHSLIMNETDRTSVGLLFHENIIDPLSNFKTENTIPFYITILENMCFEDYIDRITFQKQIWIFNEMSSLIKTFFNNKVYHETYSKKKPFNPPAIRFTKVLTKYSTEYNNMLFIQDLCRQLSMDKKDLFSFFLHSRNQKTDEEIFELFNNDNYDISKLDISRMFRYLDRYTLKQEVPSK